MNDTEIEERYRAALWYVNLKETTNARFFPLYWDRHRYLVLKGGAGSGKSIFAGRKVLERVAGEKKHRYLVCRKVARTLRESCFEQLKNQAYEYYPDSIDYIPRGKGGDMYMKFKNGSEILFAGLDDVEKLKSIYDITGIWIEEASELSESDFNQLDIRLRAETPYYQQIILTFNPVNITHWLKKRFFDLNMADPAEREKAVRRTKTHESTYKDNRFLSEDARDTLEAFKYTDEYYYGVYCLGMWGVTGKSVFDARAVSARLSENIKPVRTGYFTYTDQGLKISGIEWIDDSGGFIKIYETPESGAPYVIGCDTAGEGSDSFAAQVIDNRNGRQVCVLHRQFDEDVFAKQVYCLGIYYNTALVGIETNFSTYPVLELERLKYPKQYVRESIDDYTHRVCNSFGFMTTSKTRPVIIAGLIKAAREDIGIVLDSSTLEEMLTFVRGEDLRPVAEAGAHDDLVMALAIAHYIRPQQSYLPNAERIKQKWTPDMFEDYYGAGSKDRERLTQKWGKPN